MSDRLKHVVTGHEITSDPESLDFWKAAGYRPVDQEPAAKKAPSKRASTSKTGK